MDLNAFMDIRFQKETAEAREKNIPSEFHKITVVGAGEVQEEQIPGGLDAPAAPLLGQDWAGGTFDQPMGKFTPLGHSHAPLNPCFAAPCCFSSLPLNPTVMLWMRVKKNLFREKIRFSSKHNYVSLKASSDVIRQLPRAIKRTGNPLQKSLSLQSSSKRKHSPSISKVTQQTRRAGSAWRTPCPRRLSCLIPGLPQLQTSLNLPKPPQRCAQPWGRPLAGDVMSCSNSST